MQTIANLVNTGIECFCFLCGTQCILGQKVSTKSWMAAVSLSPLREYCYYLVLSSNIREKERRLGKQSYKAAKESSYKTILENNPIRLLLETWCSLTVSRCAASNKGNWSYWCLYSVSIPCQPGSNQAGNGSALKLRQCSVHTVATLRPNFSQTASKSRPKIVLTTASKPCLNRDQTASNVRLKSVRVTSKQPGNRVIATS